MWKRLIIWFTTENQRMVSPIASIAMICVLGYGVFRIMMWHVRRRRLYELASKFKGPPTLPIIGNAHSMLTTNTENLLNKCIELTNSYPSPFRMWLGPVLAIVVSDPDQIQLGVSKPKAHSEFQEICLSPTTLRKGWMFESFLRPLSGYGLIASPVSVWRQHRKLMQPNFNIKIMESFVDTFSKNSNILLGRWEHHLNGAEFEVHNYLSSCTLDMICETVMGVKVGSQMNQDCYYVRALEQMFSGLVQRFAYFWMGSDSIFYRTKIGRDQQKYIKYLHDFTDNVIRIRKIETSSPSDQPGAARNKDVAGDKEPRRRPFSDLLTQLTLANPDLPHEELRDEVIMTIVSGTLTTASLISFVMLMLASYPTIQDKAYRELCEIYGDDSIEERPITSKDLSQMKFLERVIKETLRFFPLASFIVREVTDELNIGEHTLPTGSTIFIGTQSLHRKKKYWPNLLKFDPDRFLPEESAKRHPFAFMAFSGGPRNCIAPNYAMMAAKTVTATILRRYVLKKDRIVPAGNVRLRLEFQMKTVDPITVRIQRRVQN